MLLRDVLPESNAVFDRLLDAGCITGSKDDRGGAYGITLDGLVMLFGLLSGLSGQADSVERVILETAAVIVGSVDVEGLVTA